MVLVARPMAFASYAVPDHVHVAKIVYDVPTDGGSIAAHTLPGVIPSGAVILDSLIVVNTTFTSATDAGTLALRIQGANDIVVAIAISNGANPWDAGVKAGVPVGTAATAIVLTAARQLIATAAVETLTAGRLTCYLFYVLPPTIETT